MKYYMFSQSSIGISFDEEVPHGSVEIGEDVYSNPDGYDVLDGKLIPPSEEYLNKIQKEKIIESNKKLSDEEYKNISEEINRLVDIMSDNTFSSESEKLGYQSQLSESRSYRVKLRNYIQSENFENDVPTKD